MPSLSRRELLMAGGAGLVAAAGGAEALAAQEASAAKPAGAKKERWKLCLNISTIRPAPLEEKIAATAKAGYDAIELWSDELARYEQGGQSLDDLRKRLKDLGLEVPNIIGIWNSMPQDEAAKAKLFEDARRRLAICAKVGARHIAAVAAPDRPDFDVPWAAARYAELVDLGKEFGVGVALEFIGQAKTVHTLGQAAAVVLESGRPEGSIVADTFHMHNGRSAWTGAKFLGGCIHAVWHFSDAPKEPPPGQMKDSDRIYPGDGILPLGQLLKDLWANGFRGPLSLELFNREEWKKPAEEVAKTGIEKMRAVIAASGTGA
ncbi:MAG: sugar phosphate isomerase/epimerase [Planctomycetes bacterium]|nr:sugar phosphate isomerase/epimerase [Planctomycetota bacterium]